MLCRETCCCPHPTLSPSSFPVNCLPLHLFCLKILSDLGQRLRWIPGNFNPYPKRNQAPTAADGLVLQFLFIFSAHQEKLTDLGAGCGVTNTCLLSKMSLAGWYSHGAKCHIFCSPSRRSSLRRVLSVRLTHRPPTVLKTQGSYIWSDELAIVSAWHKNFCSHSPTHL